MSKITSENPLGLDGFEFAEFTSPNPDEMKALIEQLGFTACSTHPTKKVVRYKQGRINLLVNQEPVGQAADFRTSHGPSANGMAFRVADAKTAFHIALERGAKAAPPEGQCLGHGRLCSAGHRRVVTLSNRPLWRRRIDLRSLDRCARRRRERSAKQRRPRSAGPSDPQRPARRDAHLVKLLQQAYSASRNRNTSI